MKERKFLLARSLPVDDAGLNLKGRAKLIYHTKIVEAVLSLDEYTVRNSQDFNASKFSTLSPFGHGKVYLSHRRQLRVQGFQLVQFFPMNHNVLKMS